MLKLMYITNNLDVALIAEKNGVDRIWIDLETMGKEERQKGLNSVKSKHSINDIKKMSPHINKAEIMVRINPWNEKSGDEIDSVIAAGAKIVMLPMWKTVKEVALFLQAVNKRVKTIILLETKEAEECLDKVLQLGKLDEIHIGLNDLHLSYGLTFMFELLSNGTVDRICSKISMAGIPYGFGGIARIGEGLLPSEKIVLEHYRLGSTRVILSRSFCNLEMIDSMQEVEDIFKNNMENLRRFERTIDTLNKDVFLENRKDIIQSIDKIVETIKEKRQNG